jgi:hypothetical protein
MGPAYRRTTREIDLSEIPPDMRAALSEYATAHQLTITEDLPAWLTRSENPPSTSAFGRLLKRRANPADPDSEHQTLVVLHPTHLIVTISGAERGVNVLSVAFAAASVADGHGLGPSAPMPEGESGFSVTGFSGDEGRPGSFYIGVGPEQAGRDCRDRVVGAVLAAKNG